MLPRAGRILPPARQPLLLLLLVVVVVCIGSSSAQLLNKGCQTPDGKQGTCVLLRSCPSIRKLVVKPDKTEAEKDFLMQAQCGIENRIVLACCPLASRITGRFGDKVDLPDTKQCGKGVQERIVGGEEAQLGSYPWLARIQYYKGNNRYGFHCGGVLIHKQYVLTAAHCIEGVPSTWIVYQVRLGEHDTTTDLDCTGADEDRECADPVRDVAIYEYLVHPDYYKENGADYNDVAVLKLSEAINYTDFISPICLPTAREPLRTDLTGIHMTVAGWGQTQTRSSSTKLLHLRIPVWENANCADVFQTVSLEIAPTQLCAGGEKGKDSCRGDSGGPLMYLRRKGNDFNWFLVGLVSFGLEQCGSNGVPGVYTRITEYMNWVQDTMESELAP